MSPPSVLIVEDEALIADDIERTLRRLGYRVVAVVADGARAVEAAAAHSPSLVLMDIKLRGQVDGVEAARAIRERIESPVVFLTSYADSATLSRASAARPYGYVLKPFVERDLRVAIELALHKHEVEQTLRSRERWFATTLGSVGDAVVATDENLTVTFLNAVAESLTGWARDDAVGRPVDEVLRLRDAAGSPLPSVVLDAVTRRAAAHLPPDTDLIRRDGTLAPVDDSAAPILDGSGAVLGAVVVLRDVRERKELERRVARSERLASLGTMAAGLCHEINNPLSCVVAGVGYSLEGLDDPTLRGDVRDSLRDAFDAATRIADVVRTFRSFARPKDPELRPTDLGAVLDAAQKLTAHVLRLHARVARRDGPAPLVLADPSQLTQVFVNLLHNAAQATPSGQAERHEVGVSLFTDAEGYAVVEVRDDGEGIDRESLPRIFDPFFTTKSPGEGMGLGLAISNSIVDALGGAILVESERGVGSTFRVRLPPAGPPPATAAVEPPVAAPRPARGRVLVIDDEEAGGRMIARVLSSHHEVVTCNDGRAALEVLLGDSRWDAVLCDLMMPTVSGIDVYQAVLAARPAVAGRFAFLTGGATTARAEAFLAGVGRPVLLKPIEPDDLRAAVDALVALSTAS